MQTRLNPYISFQGQARSAVEFYHQVFGGNLTVSTYQEGGMPHDPDEADYVMHAELATEHGIVLMVSDTPKSMPYTDGSRMSISLSGENDPELSGYFDNLSLGGVVDQPLVSSPWGDKFGMLTDQFGVHWLVNISLPKSSLE